MVFFPFLYWWIEALILAASTIAIMVSVYSGHGKYATWVVAVLGSVSFFSGGALWYLATNINFHSILTVLIYLVLGIIWSFFHWYFYIRKTVDKFNRANESGRHREKFEAPDMYEQVGRIVAWIFYWPFDIPPTFLLEPMRRFGLWCVDSLSGIYNGITNWVLKRFLKIPV